MLTKTIQDAINDQINKELYSAYLYLAMSAHCETNSLPGTAHWMRVQYQEETSHAMKFFDYVNDRGGQVVLKAIDQPPAKFKSALEIFQQVVEHERRVTESIHKLYALAVKENDYASQVLLQWFVTEQVEEEKSAGLIAEQFKMIGESKPSLIMLDRQLGKRGQG